MARNVAQRIFPTCCAKARPIRISINCARPDNVALSAVIITDHVSDGLSAVYSFFSFDGPRRSLVRNLILSLIDEAQRQGCLTFISATGSPLSRKMAYKERFRPLLALGPHCWDWIDGGIEP